MNKVKLEKRFECVRKVMAERGEDYWIIAGSEASDLKGYVRFISDWHILDGLIYVLLPLHGEPSFVLKLGSQSYWAKKKCLITDVNPSYDPTDGLIELLSNLSIQNKRIGVVGFNDIIPYTKGLKLTSTFSDTVFTEAATQLEELMLPSTPEDFASAEEIVIILKKVLERFGSELGVGRTERSVVSRAIQEIEEQGCTNGTLRLSTALSGSNRLPLDRNFEKYDIVQIYIEAAGPSGYWAEMGGVFSFTQPPENIYNKFKTTVKAMEKLGDNLIPGIEAGKLCQIAEQVYRDDGWDIIGRALWDAHGQGLCKHLPPFAWPGSTEILKENMIINQHPGVITADGIGFSLTNNFIVKEGGGKAIGGYRHNWNMVD